VIILFASALSRYLTNFKLPVSSGCSLGKRTVIPHIYALENFGIKINARKNGYYITKTNSKTNASVTLYEQGDTVTINAILTAAFTPGKTIIKFASSNYQVQDLCFFLLKLGIKISGIGANTLVVRGKNKISKNIEYSVSEDPIEAMLFISAAITTNSSILIKRCPIDFLELELLKLEKMGFKYEIVKHYRAKNEHTKLVDIKTYPSVLKAPVEKLHAQPYPGINIDNLPFFAPIATQAKGQTMIHDWAYEHRAVYFSELNCLGADVDLIDQHRVLISGPTKLKGANVVCPPALRPSTIILSAMLGARGKSTLSNIYSIERGHQDLCERLKKLGARVEKL